MLCGTTVAAEDAQLLALVPAGPDRFAATGYFNEHDATFAPGTSQETVLTNLGGADGFLAVWSF